MLHAIVACARNVKSTDQDDTCLFRVRVHRQTHKAQAHVQSSMLSYTCHVRSFYWMTHPILGDLAVGSWHARPVAEMWTAI